MNQAQGRGRPVIFGEVLFDTFPDGSAVLGGAPDHGLVRQVEAGDTAVVLVRQRPGALQVAERRFHVLADGLEALLHAAVAAHAALELGQGPVDAALLGRLTRAARPSVQRFSWEARIAEFLRLLRDHASRLIALDVQVIAIADADRDRLASIYVTLSPAK